MGLIYSMSKFNHNTLSTNKATNEISGYIKNDKYINTLKLSKIYLECMGKIDNNKSNKKIYCNKLVFSGGGIKRISELGALLIIDKLMESGIIVSDKGEKLNINKLDYYAGTSCGSIIATILSLGYTVEELFNIMTSIDYESFKDNTSGYISDLIRFIRYYGWCNGDTFGSFIGNILAYKVGNMNITFRELYKIMGNKLVVVGTNINKMKPVYFSVDTYPDMEVRVAVRISMSIPFLFRPIVLKSAENVEHTYIDGGVLDNYALEYFDKKIPNGIIEYDDKIIGLRIINSKFESIEGGNYELHNIEINSMKDYISAIFNIYFYTDDENIINDKYWERSIAIKTKYIPLSQFTITDGDKEELVNCGIKCAVQYFLKRLE